MIIDQQTRESLINEADAGARDARQKREKVKKLEKMKEASRRTSLSFAVRGSASQIDSTLDQFTEVGSKNADGLMAKIGELLLSQLQSIDPKELAKLEGISADFRGKDGAILDGLMKRVLGSQTFAVARELETASSSPDDSPRAVLARHFERQEVESSLPKGAEIIVSGIYFWDKEVKQVEASVNLVRGPQK